MGIDWNTDERYVKRCPVHYRNDPGSRDGKSLSAVFSHSITSSFARSEIFVTIFVCFFSDFLVLACIQGYMKGLKKLRADLKV